MSCTTNATHQRLTMTEMIACCLPPNEFLLRRLMMDAEVYFLSFFSLNASFQYVLELGLLVGRHDVGTYGRDIMGDYYLTIISI